MSSSSYKYLCLLNSSILTPFYLTFLLLHLTILVTGDSPQPYIPLDNIALNCGSSSESSVNDTNWTADINSKVALQDQYSVSILSTANEASTNTVPYHTARVSRSKFTYTFPVTTTGPKFVRLHFHPASYPGFNRLLVNLGEKDLREFEAERRAISREEDKLYILFFLLTTCLSLCLLYMQRQNM